MHHIQSSPPQSNVQRLAPTDAPRPAAAPLTNSDADELQGLTLADASATISSGHNLVASYVMGANNQLAEIRVIDQTTHQVIAASPPDSIARIQQEMVAYQGLGNQNQATRPA